ncbi:MAG: glycosyltransferase [Candidatus Omnitrophota bacterium]|jgi:glycosyltransferase involved in cell wall biosynthesis|nr:MAG: glycosyltransferase [Candidatus Omnitrophota bacterium]
MVTEKVSIVIPTYNRAALLERTLESALQQTYYKTEIIIVDDGSTDNTKEVVISLQDPRVVYVRNPVNVGAPESRNIGIDRSSGKYVAFLDSDDEWDPRKLEKQMDFIRQQQSTADFLCYTQIVMPNQKMYITPAKDREENQPLTEYFFLYNEFIMTSAMLFPRETIRRLRFKKDIKLFQDVDLCLRASRMPCRFLFVKEPLCTWNCDHRRDRITVNHDGYTRFCWLEINFDYFTEKSLKEYLHSFVIGSIKTVKQKRLVQQRLLQWIRDKRILMEDAFPMMKRLNSL